mmetsp:Transcript_16647/g.31532  ORF Transcript_16647/g.31532 Transcript_16647/m.31532 type:complete len:507 (-) Transcript_16647:84-1604(-)
MTLEQDIKRLQRRIVLQFIFFSAVLVVFGTFFASSITLFHKSLNQRISDIEKYNELVLNQLNVTIKDINSTVEKVQEDVEQTAQEVDNNISAQNSLLAYQFAGTFAVLGSLLSLWHIASHLRNLHAPEVQRKIVAILWMVPIYSISSWLSLVFVNAADFLGLFKDIYEAYCIYCFLSFLISILGRGDRSVVIDLLANRADHLRSPWKFPTCCRKPTTARYRNNREKAEAVLDQCQFFSMQFVFLRPLTTIAMILSDRLYEESNSWDPSFPQFYINAVTNSSIFFAFTGLLRFYHVIKDDLNWCHPFSKFLSIKAIVFMTFWQGIVISFIAHAVVVNQNGKDNPNMRQDALEWSKQAQAFVICMEMFVFAIVHCFVFPVEEWEPGYREKEKRRIRASFGDSLALKDFVEDVKIVMASKGKNKTYMQVDKMDRVSRSKEFQGEGKECDVDSTVMSLNRDLNYADDNPDWAHGLRRIQEFIEELELAKAENVTYDREEVNDLALASNLV